MHEIEIKVLEFLKERELSREYHRIDQLYGDLDFAIKLSNSEFLKQRKFIEYGQGNGIINFEDAGMNPFTGFFEDLTDISKKGELSIWAFITPNGSEYLRQEQDKRQQLENGRSSARNSKLSMKAAWTAVCVTIILGIFGFFKDVKKSTELDLRFSKSDSVIRSLEGRINSLSDSLVQIKAANSSNTVKPQTIPK